MDINLIERVNEFRYAGNAWCKFYKLSDLIQGMSLKSKVGRASHEALTAWQAGPNEKTAIELVALTIDVLLGWHMPESSSFAELNRGEWESVSAEVANEEVDQLVATHGRANGEACQCGLDALPIYKEFAADAHFNLRISIPRVDWIKAVAAIDDDYCTLFFDADT